MFLNFLIAAVFAGTPLLFGTLGEILNEKSGHLNSWSGRYDVSWCLFRFYGRFFNR